MRTSRRDYLLRIMADPSFISSAPVVSPPVVNSTAAFQVLNASVSIQHITIVPADLSEDAKIKLQSYISGCYGTLTTFNVLFADDDDQFSGAGEGA